MNQPAPFNDPRMNASDRRHQESFWMDRYQNAPPIKDPKVSELDRADGRKSGYSAGGEGFLKPGMDADAHFKQRAQELATTAIPQDKERLGVLITAEKAWVSRDNRPGDFHKAMGDLVTHDRAHGHPIADPTRDLTKQGYTDQERRQWLERGGREKSPDERAWSNSNSFDRAHMDHNTKAPDPGSAERPWWMDPGTAERVQQRQAQQQAPKPEQAPALKPQQAQQPEVKPQQTPGELGQRIQQRKLSP